MTHFLHMLNCRFYLCFLGFQNRFESLLKLSYVTLIMIGYEFGDWSSFPDRYRNLSFRCCIETCFEAHTGSYPMGTGSCMLRGKTAGALTSI